MRVLLLSVAYVLAVPLLQADAVAQDCQGLQLEASLPLAASPGAQGRVAIDQGRVWVSHGDVGLRYTQIAGAWQVDGWISQPSGSGMPPFLAADGGRVVFRNMIYLAGEQISEIGWVSMNGHTCYQNDGAWLGTHFVVFGYDCLNFVVRGTAQSGSGAFLDAPDGPPNTQTPFFMTFAKGDRALIATRQWSGAMPFRVNQYTIGGTDAATVVTGGGPIPDGPSMQAADDIVITPNGVAAALRLSNGGAGGSGVAIWDSVAWSVLPVNPTAELYFNVASVESRLVYSNWGTVFEVVRDKNGLWTSVIRWSSPGRIYDLAGDDGLVAALVEDSTVTAGSRLLLLRLIDQIDCDGNGTSDCEELASGAPDVNQNGVPDNCDCVADISGSGTVDAVDMSALLSSWGSDGQGEFDSDVDNNGVVDAQDLGIVLSGWGPCPN